MRDDDGHAPELSAPPTTPAIVRRAAPLVMAAMLAGCGDPGDPPAYDAGISAPADAGPGVPDAGVVAFDAGIQDAGPPPGPPADAGSSGD